MSKWAYEQAKEKIPEIVAILLSQNPRYAEDDEGLIHEEVKRYYKNGTNYSTDNFIIYEGEMLSHIQRAKKSNNMIDVYDGKVVITVNYRDGSCAVATYRPIVVD